MVGSSSFSSLLLQGLCEINFFMAHKILDFQFLEDSPFIIWLQYIFSRKVSQLGDFISKKKRITHKNCGFKFLFHHF
jgi:hypothetical protein